MIKPSSLLAGVLALGLLEVATYLCNPFHMTPTEPFARLWGFKSFRQTTQAMEPTIHNGEFFLISAWPYVRDDPKVGDVIAFRYPLNSSAEYVKRVIAVGGSTLAIGGGVILVDGRPLREAHVRASWAKIDSSITLNQIRIPQNCYFVMGDNRDSSIDSRTWGGVPRINVIGKFVG